MSDFTIGPDGTVTLSGSSKAKPKATTATPAKKPKPVTTPASSSGFKVLPDGTVVLTGKTKKKAKVVKTPFTTLPGSTGTATDYAAKQKNAQGMANMYMVAPQQVAKIRALENKAASKVAADASKSTWSAIGAAIDTVEQPFYGIVGAIHALITGKDPIAGGYENATAWQRKEPTKTSKDIYKALGVNTKFAVIPKNSYLPGIEADGTGTSFNSLVKWLSPNAIASNVLLGWLGGVNTLEFASDALLDPLSYGTRGGSALVKGILKTGASAAKGSHEASKLFREGFTSSRYGAAGVPSTEVPAQVKQAVTEDLKKIQSAKAQLRVEKNAKKVQAVRYRVIKKEDASIKRVGLRDPITSVLQERVGVALEGAWRAARETASNEAAAYALKKIARRDVKITAIRNKTDGGWIGTTKNKDIALSNAPTKSAAIKAAKESKNASILTSVDSVKAVNPAIQDKTKPENVTVPTETGEKVTLEPYQPYQQDNGIVLVNDGKEIREFTSNEDAINWVNIINGPEKEAAKVIVAPVKGQWRARVGDRIETFGPGAEGRKAAMEYKKAFETGQISGQPTVTKRGGNLIIDSAPPTFDLNKFANAPALSGTNKVLKEVLDRADEISKSAIATKSKNSPSVRNAVLHVVNQTQAKLDAFIKKYIAGDENVFRIFSAVTNSEITPFIAINSMLDSSSVAAREVLKKLMLSEVVLDGKARTIQSLFNEYGAAKWFKIPPPLRLQITDIFETQFNRAKALTSGAVKTGKEDIISQLVKIVGKDDAQKIVDTGYLTEKTPASTKKLNEILDGLQVKTETVRYENLNELINGLKSGHSVDFASLEKIFKAIDPEGKLENQIQRGAAESAESFVTRVLTSPDAIQTIRDTQRRVALGGDIKLLLQPTGIGFDDVIANYVEAARSGNKFEIALEHTQQAAADRIAKEWSAGGDQIANAISRGLGGQFMEITEIMASPGYTSRISSFNDLAELNVIEAYSEGSRAVLSHQIGPMLEVKIIGSLLGTSAFRQGKKALQKTEDIAYQALTPEQKRLIFIDQMDTVSDMFISLGTRIVRPKFRNDDLMNAAFLKAKGAKKPFSAIQEKHVVYLHMGDILKAFSETGAGSLIDEAFFAGKNAANDTLDWVSFGDANRLILEAKGKNIPLTEEYIVERISRRGANRGKQSAEFKNKIEGVKSALAKHMLNNTDFIAALEKAHLSKVIGHVDDSLKTADTLSGELFALLYKIWDINYLSNDLSDNARRAAIAELMRKFIWASNTLKASDGEVSEKLFQSRFLMALQGGDIATSLKSFSPETQQRLRDLGSKLPGEPTDAKRSDFMRTMETEYTKALHEYQQHVRMSKDAPPLGMEGTKKPTALKQQQAGERLGSAEQLYEKHVLERAAIYASGDNAAIAAWEKKFESLQKKLDSARENARKAWLPTRNWSTELGAWVDPAKFDYDAEVARLTELNQRYVASAKGVEDKLQYLADTRPVIPPHRILTPAQRKVLYEKYVDKARTEQLNIRLSNQEDIAARVETQLDNGEFEKLGIPERDIPMRAMEEYHAQNILETTTFRINTTYETAMKWSEAVEATPPGGTMRQAANTQKFFGMSTKLNAYAGKEQVLPILHTATSTAMVETQHFARAMYEVERKYFSTFGRKTNKSLVTADESAIVFNALKTGTPNFLKTSVGKRLSANAQSLYSDSKHFADMLYPSDGRNFLEVNGISAEDLRVHLNRVGLNESVGVFIKSKMAPSEFKNPLEWIPVGDKPKSYVKGTADGDRWLKDAETFAKSELTPFVAMAKMFEAIAFAKAEKGIAESFASQFSWKSYDGMTYQQALNDPLVKWVQIVTDNPNTPVRFLPKPEHGGLFPQPIAEQFEMLMREYDSMVNGSFSSNKKVNDFARGYMELVNTIKSFQTVLNPRHHVTSIFGDVTSAIMLGKTTDPRHWAMGNKFAIKHAKGILDAETFAQFSDPKIARQFNKAFRIINGDIKSPVGTEASGALTPTAVIYKGGKPTKVKLSDDEYLAYLEQSGIVVNQIQVNDLQNLVMGTELIGKASKSDSLGRKLLIKARTAINNLETPPGNFAAVTSNMSRIAHATNVIESRSWASLEDAFAAAAKQVNAYHPTSASLSIFERRYARMLFTYYTWSKVAMVTIASNLIEHAGMNLIPFKLQYSQAEEAGFEPQSFGNAWSNTGMAPSYLTSSPYAPTRYGSYGPQIVRPGYMFMDIAAMWSFTWDSHDVLGNFYPSKEANNLGYVIPKVLASNVSVALRPELMWLMQTDPATAGPSKFESPETTNDYLWSNIGWSQLTYGLGLTTPSSKAVENQKSLKTQQQIKEYKAWLAQDRSNALSNWLGVTKGLGDVFTPSNVTIATSELNKRIKAMIDEKRMTK